jgi:alpha-1,3-rhamnosyl/mannosyltransferase
LLHLSHYEGYGLTIVEALAARTPVVASGRGGTLEAAGGAAWLVDPDDPRQAVDALQVVFEGGEDVEARRERGLRHASGLTWERAAQRMEELYRSVGG